MKNFMQSVFIIGMIGMLVWFSCLANREDYQEFGDREIYLFLAGNPTAHPSKYQYDVNDFTIIRFTKSTVQLCVPEFWDQAKICQKANTIDQSEDSTPWRPVEAGHYILKNDPVVQMCQLNCHRRHVMFGRTQFSLDNSKPYYTLSKEEIDNVPRVSDQGESGVDSGLGQEDQGSSGYD